MVAHSTLCDGKKVFCVTKILEGTLNENKTRKLLRAIIPEMKGVMGLIRGHFKLLGYLYTA